MAEVANLVPGILTTEQLLEATGFERVADLTRILNEQNIRYFWGKGGRPWTTLDLVNAASGLVRGVPNEQRLLTVADAF